MAEREPKNSRPPLQSGGYFIDEQGILIKRTDVPPAVPSPERERGRPAAVEVFAVDEAGRLTRYRGNDTRVVLPRHVRSVGWRAFFENRTVTAVTLPERVAVIENSAFWDCTALASVTLPVGLVSIGERAFMGCSALAHVTVPATVVAIGSMAFEGTALREVAVPVGCQVSTDAFPRACRVRTFAGETLRAPQTVPASAPLGASSSEDEDFDVDSYGRLLAYRGHERRVEIPEGVKIIGWRSFFGNGTMSSLVVPEGVGYIESSVFWDCTALAEVTLPDSLVRIGERAFRGCVSLTHITIPPDVTAVGALAFSHTALRAVTLPRRCAVARDAFPKDCRVSFR